ncbi:inosine-5-monophosphate dehydrogenase [Azorhizobium oxalatiphilum]|uniref:Inosine-5-monophosphate dehydrogenase n=1 Tax=Azorhizobium oxalatiphilum TaxID=980631 RepID=A0A917CG15_9HYPH|nr:CBS domain-containing protein [Azorhizobium oxalatiphilum]GGF85111.1 inosine-5-monophosphate dehydrogenase [Azorhizobium oxalatiphilum]
MTVSAILQTKGTSIITISPEIGLGEAVETLAKHRIGAIVVTDAGDQVVGILSERDVVRLLAEKGPDVLAEPVSSVMTRTVVTCTASETIPGVMERMTRGRFRHVPVVEGGRLLGIISIGDVVKFRVEEMERESAALRDYIMTA